jgi:hypothetical protein
MNLKELSWRICTASFLKWTANCYGYDREEERQFAMKKTNWKSSLTLVNVVVGLAVLMVLSGLVVPIFVPPEGRAAPAKITTSCPRR